MTCCVYIYTLTQTIICNACAPSSVNTSLPLSAFALSEHAFVASALASMILSLHAGLYRICCKQDYAHLLFCGQQSFLLLFRNRIPCCYIFATTKLSSTSLHPMWLPCTQGQLKKPRFEDGLEGVLHLANSVSLTDTLKAADLDASVGQARGMTPLGALDAVGGAVNDVLSPV